MSETDLQAGPPRRWDAEIDGVRWLPRMIDKTRAWRSGTLGSYLFGQSPIDDAFLDVAGLDYARFVAIVDGASDDCGVLTAIAAQTPETLETLRSWSRALPIERRAHLAVLDFDDGYTGPAWARPLRTAAHAAFKPVAPLIRRLIPVRAS